MADILVSFEEMEALRWLEYLKPDGLAVVNKYRSPPVSMLSGDRAYPENMLGLISSTVNTKIIEAVQITGSLGNSRVMNIILLGTLSALNVLPFSADVLKQAISERVPPKTIDLNLKAFELGKSKI